MDLQAALHEVESVFLNQGKSRNADRFQPEQYIGGGASKLLYLNLKVPIIRTITKNGFSFSTSSISEQWKVWDYIWKTSAYYEVMLGATYFASKRPVEELYLKRKVLFGWLKRVDNWAHSDELSSLYSKILEYDHGSVMPTFETWSRSKNPWAKRQSLVGLLYYSSMRRQYPEPKLILQFVEKHMEDDHYYVQKAVGWTLRECWNIAPGLTYKYLVKNARRIPAAGWTAATEKLPPSDKAKLKELRKKKELVL